MIELNVFKGDDKDWTIYFKDSAGDPIDITGSTLYFTVKTLKTDATADAKIKKDITSHTDPTGGETTLTLTDDDTDIDVGVYFFDFKLVDSAGKKTTYVVGNFRVAQQVTSRI